MKALKSLGTSPLTTLLKKPAKALAFAISFGVLRLIRRATLMYVSNESHCMPGAFPLFKCVKVLSTFLGVNRTFRHVPPDRVDNVALIHPLLIDGGCKFCRMCRLSSLILATGACFVTLALADLKLSKSAAS